MSSQNKIRTQIYLSQRQKNNIDTLINEKDLEQSMAQVVRNALDFYYQNFCKGLEEKNETI